MKIPYIALYPAPFIADTYHLGNTELGIYWRLLLHYYQHLRPLPYDLDTVCRIAYATSPEERKAVEFILTEFFTVDTDSQGHKVWKHHRADEEIERALERVEVNQARTKAARKAKKIKRDDYCDNICDNPCDNICDNLCDRDCDNICNEGEREREIKILDLDKEVDQRERVEGGMGGDLPPPSLSLKKSANRLKIPQEEIEAAIQERPDLTHEYIVKVMARKFEIHYQGSHFTPEERAKKWMEWVVAENRNGANGNGHKSPKQIAKEERERQSALDQKRFDAHTAELLAKGKGQTTNGQEKPSHERH